MVELFRRLNSGGTPLSTLRNTLSAQQRSQAEKITVTCQILPTDPSEVTDLDDGGEKFAAFAPENYPRIKSTPVTLREFLRKTGDYNCILRRACGLIPPWKNCSTCASGICIRFIRKSSPTTSTNSPATAIICFI
ncbi:MAG: hypothetical protein IJ774_12295 [Selenomonadaceae bacterium]|nr:hypothetical protein [Selenomonadaceae bacterium]